MARLWAVWAAASLMCCGQGIDLESGWRNPPKDARPHAYWLWLNSYVDSATARAELQAMKEAGFGGVLLFDMGARGPKEFQPPAGPAFLSDAWLRQFREAVQEAHRLGLQVDFSAVSSWDLGGHWTKPEHASMGLYPTETVIEGGRAIDLELPFPEAAPAAPKGPDGRPAFWREAAVLAVRDARRGEGHEFVIRLDNDADQRLTGAVLDNGSPGTSPATAHMSPVREFSLAVSETSSGLKEVLRATLKREAGAQRFALPAGLRGRYIRLRLLNAHDDSKPRWTLGEFSLLDGSGRNVAGAYVADITRRGATVVRSTAPLGYGAEWNRDNLHDGNTNGPGGVFATAGPPPLVLGSVADAVDITRFVSGSGRLRWNAPAGRWTILRYVVMNTGERLKAPSPNSDGWATDHFNGEATRAHMDHVIARVRESLGEPAASGLRNLYLASYEVVGPVWSPGFIAEFGKRRGYDMTPYLPAIFGARIESDDRTERFLFDYRTTLSDLLIDAYYNAAREAAHRAGLGIKSEAGGPGPPVHNVPVDSLLANAAVDEIQGEFWPFRWNAEGLWVVKETASAGHIYGKPRVHMESFTSFDQWRESPQDLKPSADRVFIEGGNHIVWHTWSHAPPDSGQPGWVYAAGSHINRNVTWWPKIKPFVDYLSRSSYLLQRGRFVGDVLYYYGDGGYRFVGPRKIQPGLGPGYDYDYTNSDVILNRLSVRDGRYVLPDGTSYAVLVMPEEDEANPAVLEKIARMVEAGGTLIGPKPSRAAGLEGYPESDTRVRELAAKLWSDLDGRTRTARAVGKGRVIWGKPVREVLEGMGIGPDFCCQGDLDFIHRRDGDADIYFVRNTRAEPLRQAARFRIEGREPELWDPRTGSIEVAPGYRKVAGGMEAPLDLAPNGSVFVVFRREARTPPRAVPATASKALSITGPWTVSFEAGRKAPESIVLPRLESWTARADPGVKYFSGTARYRTKFAVPRGFAAGGKRAELDLGRVWAMGEAWLNGKPLGIVWTAPFRLDCSEALQPGENVLEVEVVNTWFNRLVGDAKLPASERITRTNVTVTGGKPWADHEPVESGLLGPVRLVVR